MENLNANRNRILEIRKKVNNLDSSLFTHYIINNYKITDESTSIIMTTSNRSKQTYFTLQSMLKSKNKNIQIIIVDDSDIDPLNVNILKNYPYYIDLIVIKRENKNWVNPVVNYNIGFKFIQGDKIVIQNAEVCHIGDPLDFINNNIEKNNYYVFDVKSVNNLESNEEIYKSDIADINIYDKPFFHIWYQHVVHHNRNLHFFTAMMRETFKNVIEFSYDYAFGIDFDDDDFLLKITSNDIKIINVEYDKYKMGGIHLYHEKAQFSWGHNKISNKEIFDNKKQYYEINKTYINYID